MVISLRSGTVSFLSPITVILALAHSKCLMSRRVMGENEVSDAKALLERRARKH